MVFFKKKIAPVSWPLIEFLSDDEISRILVDFKRIYLCIYAGETTFFKNKKFIEEYSEFNDDDKNLLKLIYDTGIRNPKSRIAVSLNVLFLAEGSETDDADIIYRMHAEALKRSGLFSRSKNFAVAENRSNALNIINSSSNGSRTQIIRDEWRKCNSKTKPPT